LKTVFIENLHFKTIIGVLEFEREIPQKIRVDAEFIGKDFINYAQACEFIEMKFHEMKFALVEDALDFFALEFKALFPSLKEFSMKITKKEIIKNAKVGVKGKFNY